MLDGSIPNVSCAVWSDKFQQLLIRLNLLYKKLIYENIAQVSVIKNLMQVHASVLRGIQLRSIR